MPPGWFAHSVRIVRVARECVVIVFSSVQHFEMESERSCCSRFKYCGILIFSIINMIIVSISLVACFAYIGFLIDIEINPWRHKMDGIGLILNQLFCFILSIFFGIAFIHAVLLCYGAHKKKPAFLMAYFVYGITVELIVASGGITLFLMGVIYYPHVIILTLCAVGYAFILAMVYRAYEAMSKNSLQNEHKKLRSQYAVL